MRGGRHASLQSRRFHREGPLPARDAYAQFAQRSNCPTVGGTPRNFRNRELPVSAIYEDFKVPLTRRLGLDERHRRVLSRVKKHLSSKGIEMRKLLFASATIGALACPVSSFAQSSVTLYGLIDEGFNYTTNAGGQPNQQLA